MAIPLRHDASPPGRFLRPEEVPARVSDELLQAVLRHGRPPAAEDELVVDGLRCPVLRRAGRGPAGQAPKRSLLCVHGLGHDARDFSALFTNDSDDAGLADVERVALDLPGFGLADKPRGELTLALLVRAVLLAARSCTRPPVVVGSSLGGHIALLAALDEPAAFESLFLVSPGGLEVSPPSVAAMARSYYSVEAICSRSEYDVVRNSRRIFAGAHPAREALAARKLALHRSPQREAFARPFASVVRDVFRHPVGERLGALRLPVQLLFGAGDVIVPPSVGERAAQRHDLPLTVIEQSGHLPMVETPAAFIRALCAFLAGRSATEQAATEQRTDEQREGPHVPR